MRMVRMVRRSIRSAGPWVVGGISTARLCCAGEEGRGLPARKKEKGGIRTPTGQAMQRR